MRGWLRLARVMEGRPDCLDFTLAPGPVCSRRKARGGTSSQPTVPLAQGLEKTVAYFDALLAGRETAR
jgi:hypothetical protein